MVSTLGPMFLSSTIELAPTPSYLDLKAPVLAGSISRNAEPPSNEAGVYLYAGSAERAFL